MKARGTGSDPSAAPEAIAWARSGLMPLTGAPDGPPLMGPPGLPRIVRAGVDRLARSAGSDALAALDAPALLGERAAAWGQRRRGTTSVGGSARLLPTRDGTLCLNLPRESDLELLPAWLAPMPGDVPPTRDLDRAWKHIAPVIARSPTDALLERGRELGLALAPVAPVPAVAPPPGWRIAARGPRREAVERTTRGPLVVDLSTLWAGPLATQLLGLAGARVIKVESRARMDGARHGPAPFFDLLNGEKESVLLDFRDTADVAALRALVLRADIVVESARPRALAQLGLDAEALVARRAGLTWVAISGHGRAAPGAGWIAFGDDAAVGAGFAAAMAELAGGGPIFCADALGDPLAGLAAAELAHRHWRAGEAALVDLSMTGVARALLHESLGPGWTERPSVAVAEPRIRAASRPAPAAGADTRAVLEELVPERERATC